MKYNVVLPVPAEVHPAFDYVVKRFRGSCAEVHAKGHRHVTLCLIVTDRSQEFLVEQLLQIKHAPVVVQSMGVPALFGSARECLVVPCVRSSALQVLHEDVARRLYSPLSTKERVCSDVLCREDVERGLACLQYGSPWFGPFYHPHVTLAELSQEVTAHQVPVHVSWQASAFELWKKSGCLQNDGWESVASFPLDS